jgi:phenylalanyl-tRNA synthetase beta chain
MHVRGEARRSLHALRHELAEAGYYEVINFSFVAPQWEADFAGNQEGIRVLNPIASQLSVMRTTLIGGLIEKIGYNINRKQERIRLFEIGRVFLRTPGSPEGDLEVAGVTQPVRIAAAAFGAVAPEQWGVPSRAVDFFDMKGDLEDLFAGHRLAFEAGAHPAFHPGRTARVLLAGEAVGWIGELHPMLQQKYELPGNVVLFEVDAGALQDTQLPRYEEVSKYPAVTRDLSVLVDAHLAVQTLIDDILGLNLAGVRSISLFDLYQGVGIPDGKKSLAFRILLQDTQRTLTDAEIDAAILRVRERLSHQFGAQLRGNEG